MPPSRERFERPATLKELVHYTISRAFVDRETVGNLTRESIVGGGHLAAWEEPALFASELRAAFKPLR